MKLVIRWLTHPLTQINLLLVGFLLIVGMIQNHAHYTMEVDADSYVRAWCKKNPDTCQSYINDY